MITSLLHDHILSLIIFAPLVGMALIMLTPRKYEEASREIALVTTLGVLGLTVWLVMLYDQFNPSGFSFVETAPWISALHVNYTVGIDGVSLLLIALTALLAPLCVLVSWNDIKGRRKEFMGLLLATEVGLIGAFCAMDLFLFYIFWEIMLIPMYFLVGIWGGANRVKAAMKLLIYTLFGSLLMLVAIMYLYGAAGSTFDLPSLYKVSLDPKVQIWLFSAFALAFAIKVPLFPFHTWLPDAHTEAPTAGSVLLAGVFLKVGTYGFYRIAMPLFPDAVVYFHTTFMVLSVIGIVAGALVSLVQPDIKRVIAYSSVSHLGFVMMGLFAMNPEGVEGAVIQMINHGISTGALFLLFGMIYERTHTRQMADYGGIARVVPLLTVCFIITSLSSLGMPGLNNFVGEFLTLMGTFKVSIPLASIAATGVIFAAGYLLWLIERVFFGPITRDFNRGLTDMRLREWVTVAPLLVLMVVLGVYPSLAMRYIKPSVASFIAMTSASHVSTIDVGSEQSEIKEMVTWAK